MIATAAAKRTRRGADPGWPPRQNTTASGSARSISNWYGRLRMSATCHAYQAATMAVGRIQRARRLYVRDTLARRRTNYNST